MLGNTPFFAGTTSWLYKAYHLVLIVCGDVQGDTNIAVVTGIAVSTGLVIAVCVVPAMVNPVRDRRKTNALLVQTVLMLSATNAGVHIAVAWERASVAALWAQLLTGHIFYSLAVTCLREKHLVVGAPFVTIVTGAAALSMPLVACMTGARPHEVHGLGLVLALGVGELCGLCIYCVAQIVHAGGGAYEYLVRMLCE